jgi:cytochrome c oxidase cbb3-type subunit 3
MTKPRWFRLGLLLLLGSVTLTITLTLHSLLQAAVAKPVGGASGGTAADSVALKGETLFNIHCAACHQAGALGQVGFAPSIRNRDFLALASDEFIKQTIRTGRPGTAMVARPDLVDDQLDAIVAYLRSLPSARAVPIKVDATLKLQGDPKAGDALFATYCASCHGAHGEGYMAGVPGTGIGLPGFLDAVPDDYIFQTLKIGRIGTPMQPFIGARGLANLTEQNAKDIIAHLRYLGSTYAERMANMPVGPGNAKAGAIHFTVNCAPCHQAGGVGKPGFAPSVRNRDFLALASDDFIRQTIHDGRAGTGMLPRPDLPKQTVNDIIAYLRALPIPNPVAIKVDPTLKFSGDAAHGSSLFGNYCASCHGPNGEGYAIGVPGPAIGLPGFLKVASDDYIFQTLKRGRSGTPMKSFSGAGGLASLTESDLHDVIAHLRVLETKQPDPNAAEEENPFE